MTRVSSDDKGFMRYKTNMPKYKTNMPKYKTNMFLKGNVYDVGHIMSAGWLE